MQRIPGVDDARRSKVLADNRDVHETSPFHARPQTFDVRAADSDTRAIGSESGELAVQYLEYTAQHVSACACQAQRLSTAIAPTRIAGARIYAGTDYNAGLQAWFEPRRTALKESQT